MNIGIYHTIYIRDIYRVPREDLPIAISFEIMEIGDIIILFLL